MTPVRQLIILTLMALSLSACVTVPQNAVLTPHLNLPTIHSTKKMPVRLHIINAAIDRSKTGELGAPYLRINIPGIGYQTITPSHSHPWGGRYFKHHADVRLNQSMLQLLKSTITQSLQARGYKVVSTANAGLLQVTLHSFEYNERRAFSHNIGQISCQFSIKASFPSIVTINAPAFYQHSFKIQRAMKLTVFQNRAQVENEVDTLLTGVGATIAGDHALWHYLTAGFFND